MSDKPKIGLQLALFLIRSGSMQRAAAVLIMRVVAVSSLNDPAPGLRR
jgi:hypothetical protein